MDIALAQAKQSWRAVDAIVDGLPLPLIIKGEARRDQMASEGVTIDDVLTAAREAHGIARLDQVDSAVLEQSGGISIVPEESNPKPEAVRRPKPKPGPQSAPGIPVASRSVQLRRAVWACRLMASIRPVA